MGKRKRERAAQDRPDVTGDSTGLDLGHVIAPIMMSSAGQLSHALVELETLIVREEAARLAGQDRQATELAIYGQALACVRLDRAIEGLALPSNVEQHLHEYGDDVMQFLKNGTVSTQLNEASGNSHPALDQFRDTEVALLRLAGLGAQLADLHYDSALTSYREAQPTDCDAERQLKAARDAVCEAAETAAMEELLRNQTAHRRRILRLTSTVLGGTLLAAANGLGALTGVGVPIAAASAALGGGAAGGVVELLELLRKRR